MNLPFNTFTLSSFSRCTYMNSSFLSIISASIGFMSEGNTFSLPSCSGCFRSAFFTFVFMSVSSDSLIKRKYRLSSSASSLIEAFITSSVAGEPLSLYRTIFANTISKYFSCKNLSLYLVPPSISVSIPKR